MTIKDYSTFAIVDQREIYLPRSLRARCAGSRLTAMKMRATQSPVETETYVEIDLETLENWSAYDQSPDAYYETYRTLPVTRRRSSSRSRNRHPSRSIAPTISALTASMTKKTTTISPTNTST